MVGGAERGWHGLSHAEGELFTRRLKSSRRVESTSTSRGKLTGGADGFPRPPHPPAPYWLHAGTLLRIGDVVRVQSPVQGKLKRKKKFKKYHVYFFGLQCPRMSNGHQIKSLQSKESKGTLANHKAGGKKQTGKSVKKNSKWHQMRRSHVGSVSSYNSSGG